MDLNNAMRLLHSTNFTLHEFYGDSIPPYAILSHRWETEEITINDLRVGISNTRRGFGKVTGCCEKARADGWEYVVSSVGILPPIKSSEL